MKFLIYFLALSTVLIYLFTIMAISGQGFNWPLIAINDLAALNWRSQFNFDFIVHLFLLATWVVWREGATKRAYLFGFLSVIMGGMFSFPYIIYTAIKAECNVSEMLLGVHAKKRENKANECLHTSNNTLNTFPQA